MLGFQWIKFAIWSSLTIHICLWNIYTTWYKNFHCILPHFKQNLDWWSLLKPTDWWKIHKHVHRNYTWLNISALNISCIIRIPIMWCCKGNIWIWKHHLKHKISIKCKLKNKHNFHCNASIMLLYKILILIEVMTLMTLILPKVMVYLSKSIPAKHPKLYPLQETNWDKVTVNVSSQQKMAQKIYAFHWTHVAYGMETVNWRFYKRWNYPWTSTGNPKCKGILTHWALSGLMHFHK